MKSRIIVDTYKVTYHDQIIGFYCIWDDRTVSFTNYSGVSADIAEDVEKLGLFRRISNRKSIGLFSQIMIPENRISGRKRIVYNSEHLMVERCPKATGCIYTVYRRRASRNAPDYSELSHEVSINGGSVTARAERYAFIKLDDGTFSASLEESWYRGGSHNDGGTVSEQIPEAWFNYQYDDFLEKIVTLSTASRYGFRTALLKNRNGLKVFFGFEN
jgi:hypothetical protein